ncbi:mechanosensitive ion channel family protein [Marinobacter sp. C2H3]|uniref:mechanosensitive ion channel family protein n=1 Tax=Marinobacter sp. C2H3 TaxID=3119003 RepID=UPI00300EAB6C
MEQGTEALKNVLAAMTSQALLEAFLVVAFAALVILAIQKVLPGIAARIGGKPRLYLLASVPLLRLVVIVVTIVVVVPILIEPSFENMVAVFGAVGLALGFAFKDYVSSLIAGLVVLYEMPYRPGDWIEVDGYYGEVRSIGTRAAEIVTPDDTVVVIPHGRLWTALIANGNDGSDDLMCVAEFHLAPGHDVGLVQARLRDAAFTSPFTKTHKPVIVVVAHRPWGLTYRVKAYPLEPRQQFQFISDLTARGDEVLSHLGVEWATVPLATNV